jgi:predicted amidohydrolase
MDIALGDKAKNLEMAVQMVNEAAKRQIDILVFPELFTTGYCLDQASILAEESKGHTINLLRDLAGRFRIFIIAGSILERQGEKIYNTTFLIGKDGRILGSYSKTHLFPPFEENRFIEPGNELSIFKTELGLFGIMICFDIRFPEVARSLTLLGGQIIFCPAEFPTERSSVWATLLRARAIENQVFVIGCNRVGSDGKHLFGGRSAIIDPTGKTLAQAEDTAQLIDSELDLSQIKKARSELPQLKSRRKTVYHL